jgi:methylglutaconyl-CoA hydratase
MEFVLTRKSGRIFEIILNRFDKRNALNSLFVQELTIAFLEADKDPEVRVIILKSMGKVFSAGADLEYLQQLQHNSLEANMEDSNQLKNLFKFIYLQKKIVIAQVEGHAIAGGCGLVTVCDFAFSVPEAMFGYTEVKIGFIPAIVSYFLIRKVGEAKARELLLTGKLVKADFMEKIGIVNEIIEPDKIDAYVMGFAEKLATETSANSIAATRSLIAEIQTYRPFDALNYAAEMNARVRMHEDCRKGIAAFLDKGEVGW